MFEQSDSYARLCNAYQFAAPASLGLFLGAGVNLPAGAIKTRYATYTWAELLEALYIRNRGCFNTSFDTLRAPYGNDWPRFAQMLIQTIGNALELDEPATVKYLAEQLDRIIYSDIPRQDKYRRLAKSFLDQAPTLHAAICFTAQINQRRSQSWTFASNPRIGTVITLNYDFFFGAGWTRYQKFDRHWRVQTPFSQSKLVGPQKPIYYLHGYLPYQANPRRKIILRQAEYDEFYARGGFARQTLEHVVQKYNLIFIGTLFTDQPLCEILQAARGTSPRQHFAIVRHGEAEHVSELGVCRVQVDEYSEVARALETVYCAALTEETWRKFGFASPAQYWEQLRLGPHS